MSDYGSCVALGSSAVLLRGPSASGKSDLALRLIEAGGVLVADDQVLLSAEGNAVIAAPPRGLAGLIEVRGVGLMKVPYRSGVPLALVCDLIAREAVERLPEPRQAVLLGVTLPLIALCAYDASAPAKLRLAFAQCR